MRFPAPCRWANPALPIRRIETIRPATRTSRLFASSSGPVVSQNFSTSAAGVFVHRNSRGYGSWPRARICSIFFWRWSNWSRGSNSKENILSVKTETEYSDAMFQEQGTGNVNPVNEVGGTARYSTNLRDEGLRLWSWRRGSKTLIKHHYKA